MSEAAEAAVVAEEFSSITVVIDHLADLAGKTVIKAIFGTDTAREALLDQIAYFQQTGLLLDAGVRAMADAEGPVAYVYTVNDRQTQIIVDTELFDSVVANPVLGGGTYLGAFTALSVMATDMIKAAGRTGEGSPILLFKPN